MRAKTQDSSKRVVASRRGRPPVEVDSSKIRALFVVPQPIAAKTLGISLTALKQLCRKMGVSRWPYRRGGELWQLCTETPKKSTGPYPIGGKPEDLSISNAEEDCKYSVAESHLSRATSTPSCVPTMFDEFSSSSLDELFHEQPNVAIHEYSFVCAANAHQERAYDTDFDGEDDESGINRMLTISGEWADRHAREATHQLG